MRKKLYILADILTLTRGMIGIAIGLILIMPVSVFSSPDVVIWLFVAGELFDAFDGICARRWHYPNDGKQRWWRNHASELDQAADITLIITTALYIICRLKRSDLLALGEIVIIFCIIVEWIKSSRGCSKRLILFRRYVYLACIALVLFALLFATSWSRLAKGAAIVAILVVGIILMIVKRNRLTQDVTEL